MSGNDVQGATPNEWYVLRDDHTYGPFDTEAMVHQLRAGRLVWNDFLWREGMNAWLEACEIETFIDALQWPKKRLTTPSAAPIPVEDAPRPGHALGEDSGLIDLRAMEATEAALVAEPPASVQADPFAAEQDELPIARPDTLAPLVIEQAAVAQTPPRRGALVATGLGVLAAAGFLFFGPTYGAPSPVDEQGPVAAAPRITTPIEAEPTIAEVSAPSQEDLVEAAGLEQAIAEEAVTVLAADEPVAPPALNAPQAEPVVQAPPVREVAAPSATLERLMRGDVVPPPVAAPAAPAQAPAEVVEVTAPVVPEPEVQSAPVVAANAEPKAIDPTDRSIDALLDNAVSGIPVMPSRSETHKAMRAVAPEVKACVRGTDASGTAKIEMKVEPSGRVVAARVKGVEGEVANCIERVAQNARFPIFTKPEFQVVYPVRLASR